jgi:hypothetical protein
MIYLISAHLALPAYEDDRTPTMPSIMLFAPVDVAISAPDPPASEHDIALPGVDVASPIDHDSKPFTGPLVTLAPDQTPSGYPLALVPGHNGTQILIDNSMAFIPNDPEPTLDAAASATVNHQYSPILNPFLGNEKVGEVPKGDWQADAENAVPLPVLVADNQPDEEDDIPAFPSPNNQDTALKNTSEWNRHTLTQKARNLRSQASLAVQDCLRLEAERKQATQEGRKKDAILRQCERDDAAKKARHLSERANRYYYRGMPLFGFSDHLRSLTQSYDSGQYRFTTTICRPSSCGRIFCIAND